MSLIVDASVAVKWFAAEEGSERAEALLEGEELIAPDLIVAEVGNTMWKKFRKRWLTQTQVIAAIEQLPRYFSRMISTPDLAPRAMELALLQDHPIYDCFYMALAERERLPIVTADERLLAAARKLGTVEARPL
jgi:predicted nucleic acid-binding protein